MIRNLRKRSSTAWTQFAEVFGDIVLDQISKDQIQPADAADISQEVLEAVLLNIDRYRHDSKRHGSFRAWLWGITRHKVLDYYRQKKRDPPPAGSGVEAVTDTQLAGLATDDELLDALSPIAAIIESVRTDFSPQNWQVFWRAVMHDEPIAQIAREMNIAPGAARQGKYRVTVRLRDELDRLYYDEKSASK